MSEAEAAEAKARDDPEGDPEPEPRQDEFVVRAAQCGTCIYRPDSRLDVGELERETKNRKGRMVRWRQCHHHDDPCCCRGFWDRHADHCEPLEVATVLERLWPGSIRFAIPAPRQR